MLPVPRSLLKVPPGLRADFGLHSFTGQQGVQRGPATAWAVSAVFARTSDLKDFEHLGKKQAAKPGILHCAPAAEAQWLKPPLQAPMALIAPCVPSMCAPSLCASPTAHHPCVHSLLCVTHVSIIACAASLCAPLPEHHRGVHQPLCAPSLCLLLCSIPVCNFCPSC